MVIITTVNITFTDLVPKPSIVEEIVKPYKSETAINGGTWSK